MKPLIDAVERSLVERNYYAALAVALALPDIVGWIGDPNVPSRRRCVDWFNRYMKPKYVRVATSASPEHVFLSGGDFYALRCAYLHEGRDEITSQHARQVLEDFQFVVPPPGWTVHCNQSNDTLQLQVDLFCRDIVAGVEACLNDLQHDQKAQQRLSSQFVLRDVNGKPLA